MLKKLVYRLLCNNLTGSVIYAFCKENVPDLRWPGFKFRIPPSSVNKEMTASALNRMKEEVEHMKKIDAEPAFFTAEEMKVITILGDIIIPKDAVSGSASDAGVPAFIEFIVKDKPEFQTPLRGGIRSAICLPSTSASTGPVRRDGFHRSTSTKRPRNT